MHNNEQIYNSYSRTRSKGRRGEVEKASKHNFLSLKGAVHTSVGFLCQVNNTV